MCMALFRANKRHTDSIKQTGSFSVGDRLNFFGGMIGVADVGDLLPGRLISLET